MTKTRLRLLVLTAVLTSTALLSTAQTAAAACTRYCWHVDADTSCCRLPDCSIVC